MYDETRPTTVPRPPRATSWPDVHSSTDDYARRFAGAAGEFLLAVQTRELLHLLAPWRGGRVLDVGGGHAQAAAPLAAAGFDVTVLGSEPNTFDRVRALDTADRITCVQGDLDAASLPARDYDVVIALRMLAHVQQPQEFLAGLCRVARDAVIVEYPAVASFNVLGPLLFRLKRRVEGNTRRYRSFRSTEVCSPLADHGFDITATSKQLFWPIALHRLFRRPVLSRLLEAPPRAIGLTRWIGSPVLLRATKTPKSSCTSEAP